MSVYYSYNIELNIEYRALMSITIFSHMQNNFKHLPLRISACQTNLQRTEPSGDSCWPEWFPRHYKLLGNLSWSLALKIRIKMKSRNLFGRMLTEFASPLFLYFFHSLLYLHVYHTKVCTFLDTVHILSEDIKCIQLN